MESLLDAELRPLVTPLLALVLIVTDTWMSIVLLPPRLSLLPLKGNPLAIKRQEQHTKIIHTHTKQNKLLVRSLRQQL